MGISTLYNIGSSGVRAQRLAIDVTGQNIANVNTEGYSRQQVVFEEEPTSFTNGLPLGTGVKVAAIQRSYDTLLQQQMVNGGSSLQQSTVEQSALQRIEPLFNELGADGLGKAVSDYFGAWQDLSLNPTGTPERQAVYTRAQIMTDTFHQVSSGLQATSAVANASLTDITSSITDIASNIARLNGMITTTEQLGNGSNANELRDQRDLLVQQLGEKAGINYYENRDGTVDVKLAGYELVVGQKSAQVYNSPVGSLSSSDIYITQLGTPPTKSTDPVTSLPTDAKIYSTDNAKNGLSNQLSYLGELGGTLNVRDHIVPDIVAKVDAIASSVASQVNYIHKQGFYFDAAGTQQPGGNFFKDASTITAENIALDPTLKTTTIAAGNQYANPPTNTTAASIVPGNNNNALWMAGLLSQTAVQPPNQSVTITAASPKTISGVDTTKLTKGMVVTGAGIATGTTITGVDATAGSITLSKPATAGNPTLSFGFSIVGSSYTSLVSEIGVNVQNAENVTANHENFMRQISNLRESNSGVSLDEELTNLVKYQRAFEGSAKLINVATEMLDTVLGLIR